MEIIIIVYFSIPLKSRPRLVTEETLRFTVNRELISKILFFIDSTVYRSKLLLLIF